MQDFEYTVETSKSFDDAVRAVEQNTPAHGFRVLHTHDVAATLAEKGFQREPLKIIEICNAKYAHEVLEKDVSAALMLPCPIVVLQHGGYTRISTMRPTLMSQMYPGKGLDEIAALVEKTAIAIVDASAK